MRIQAEDDQRRGKALAKAETRSELDLASKRLDEGIVTLVARFQAASGGYEAVRCDAGAWTCFEPKRSKDLLQSEQFVCTWVCVPILGPCTRCVGRLTSGQPVK
jgi:hypothetical protein